jgi:chemotaxis protein methyltransferase CheR
MLGTKMQAQELAAADFRSIRDFIHDRSGIFYPESKKYILENRLSRRMAELGIKSYRDYLYLVKYDVSQKEFNHLMNLTTTNETSFFRNPPQLNAFAREILPVVVESKRAANELRLRIWSAGCSTGEEPYTLAIILRQEIRDIDNWNVEILANDISERVLYKARKGVYGELSLRSTDRQIVEEYFSREGDGYRVSDDIKKYVKLNHVNLADSRKLSMYAGMDIIFCRNVMIYFSDEVKKELVRSFYTCLNPGGFLFIGHSESLHGISRAFKLSYFKNALVYRKEARDDRMRDSDAAGEARRVVTAAERMTRGYKKPVPERTKATLSKLEEMRRFLASTK